MPATLKQWEEKDYRVSSASIRFIVAWKPKDAERREGEYTVPLIDLKQRIYNK